MKTSRSSHRHSSNTKTWESFSVSQTNRSRRVKDQKHINTDETQREQRRAQRHKVHLLACFQPALQEDFNGCHMNVSRYATSSSSEQPEQWNIMSQTASTRGHTRESARLIHSALRFSVAAAQRSHSAEHLHTLKCFSFSVQNDVFSVVPQHWAVADIHLCFHFSRLLQFLSTTVRNVVKKSWI